MKYTALALAGLLTLSACSLPEVPVEEPVEATVSVVETETSMGLELYQDDVLGFELMIPTKWNDYDYIVLHREVTPETRFQEDYLTVAAAAADISMQVTRFAGDIGEGNLYELTDIVKISQADYDKYQEFMRTEADGPMTIGEKFASHNGYVYLKSIPFPMITNQFEEDGSPIPDFDTFKAL